ncbi:outer membrane protein assembly factor BamB [Novilysobacter avium]|uniref:Outer membrane protein assembly factor BamB n=1 Tax=Novilysobacter avium TaxID=2781023 RepID=A0A7S6UMS9_9GAMM|nr:outer membrane protein assembly factor BamB [Lysobacter avium]QOW23155.1 outer membrane protein assembly factor BamB [Lysobacter avium]
MNAASKLSNIRPPARQLVVRVSVLVLCATALVGCSTMKGWFSSDKKKAAAPAALVEFQPSAQPSRIWSANVGNGEGKIGARQGPVIANGKVFAAAVKGGVHAYDLQSGAKVWSYPSKLRLTGGPGVGEGVVAVGSLDGDVVALDADTGSEKWTAKLGNEIIAAPAVGMGMVFVRSNDGRITAFDAASGERRWFWNHDVPMLSVRGNDTPVLGPGYLFVGNDDGTVVALSANDGRPLWEESVAQQEGRTELSRMADVDGAPVLDGTSLYATSYKGKTIAIDAPSGQPMWISDHGGPGRIGVGPNVLVVSDSADKVVGLYKTGGSAMWTQPAMTRRNLTAPAIQGDYAVVGDLDGYLHWLSLDTGEFAARTRVGRDRLLSAPRVADGILVVQDVGGKLSAYRLGQ